MKYCPECDELIPLDAVYCQYCGINTQDPDDKTNRSSSSNKTDMGSDARSKRTPRQHVPFSQVLVSLLLLLVTFWGLSLSLTVLPIFIDPAYTDHLLPVGISVQVALRILIAFLAIDGRYAQGRGTIEGKIATAILAFIPVGALYSFLYASRSLSHRRQLPALMSSSVGTSALAAVLIISTYSPLRGVAAEIGTENIPVVENNLTPRETAQSATATSTISPKADDPTLEVSNLQVGSASDKGCIAPADVTLDMEGEIVDVCGEVTNYGELDCEWCPKGKVSYILLDKSFRIISYDWEFTFAWLGDCIKVSDNVEVFGGKPVLNFSRGEGYSGSKCYTDTQGELICNDGGYFQKYDHCRPTP